MSEADWGGLRYNAYGPWLRKRFGSVVYKVAVDGGFSCPNRDGTVARGGCTYCDNRAFRAVGSARGREIREQVEAGIDFLERRYKAERFLVYFQSFSGSYSSPERLREVWGSAVESDPRIVGLLVGTRPDCVGEGRLDLLREVAGDRFAGVEFGIESVYDETLRRVNRGHDFACLREAVAKARRARLSVCGHVIFGFPWESTEDRLAYCPELNRLGLDFLKIHHLHVVRGTPLAAEWERAPFPTYSAEEWISFVCDLLERLGPDVVIQRLFGSAPNGEVLAPTWGLRREVLLHRIHRELERRGTRQGALAGQAGRPAPASGGC